VATGNHIDTQPTGGKFDGNYGWLAGQEVLRTLADHGIRTRAARWARCRCFRTRAAPFRGGVSLWSG